MTPPDLDRLETWVRSRAGMSDAEATVALLALLAPVRAVEADLKYARESWSLVDQKCSRLDGELAQAKLDLDIAQGAHEHDCGIFQERWCTCRVAPAPVDVALLDRLVEAREWMDTVIHGGAKFAKGSTLVDGEHLLERIDAALMQEPAPADAAAVERVARAILSEHDPRPCCACWATWEDCGDAAILAIAALRAASATRTADGG